MMNRRHKRLAVIAFLLAVLGGSAGLVLVALNDSIVFFNSPSDILAKPPSPGQRLRLGGLVEAGSVERLPGEVVKFVVSDGVNQRRVSYVGLLPDLFREGQGVVAEGRLEADGVFRADTILAKHDETYMPREVAEALKRKGVWQGGTPEIRDKNGKPGS